MYAAGCTPDANTVCLLSNRFQVKIDYVNPFSNPPNQPGTFLAARLLQGAQNPDTALFGFSSAQAVEVVVRVQDARPFAQRFDIYYGGMTDVGYTVHVTDTQTGLAREYVNPVGKVGGGVDRTSFAANTLLDSFPADIPSIKTGARLHGAASSSGSRKPRTNAGGAGACAEVEPNNSIWDSQELAFGVPCGGFAAVGDSYEYTVNFSNAPPGRIHDVYMVTLPVNGQISAKLTFTNASADLDIFLFYLDEEGDVRIVEDATTDQTTEELTSSILGYGEWYVGVSAYAGSSPYTLTINGGPVVPAAPTNLTATGISTSVIRLTWTDNATNESIYVVERKVGVSWVTLQPPLLPANSTSADIGGLAANTTATFRVKARNGSGDSPYSNEATGTTLGNGGCVPNATTACLLNNRFQVKIDYVNPFSNPPNQPGTFLAARLLEGVQNPDTALFGFSSAQAVEVVVRVQDTRPFAPRFDVYYGGMTDVGYTVTVTDTQTGVTRQYTNNVGTVGGGVDRTSFPAN